MCLAAIVSLGLGGSATGLVVGELEPNDTAATANPLLPGQHAHGQIPSGPEYDTWVIPGARTDQVLCALLTSPNDGGDPVLSAYFNHEATDTAAADLYNDDGGPNSSAFDDSFLCGDPITRAGALFLRADGFGSSLLDPYLLFATLIGPEDVAPEAEPNDTAATATPITAPAMSGLGRADPDFYSFEAEVGQPIVVMMDSDPGRPDPPAPFVHMLTLLDHDGSTALVAAGDPTFIDTDANDVIGAYPAPSSGTFFVRVDKSGADDREYRLVVLVDGDAPIAVACCFAQTCAISSAGNCRGLFAGPARRARATPTATAWSTPATTAPRSRT